MNDPIDGGDNENYAGYLTNDLTVYVDLEKYLEANKGRLTLCHINCNHLIPHINELRLLLQNSGIDVIGVGETFLTASIASKAVELSGYRFIRNDRTVFSRPDTAGGGVGLYVKNNLRHSIVAQSVGLGIEYIFIEINGIGKKILVGLIYRPPNTSIVYRGIDAGNFGLFELEKILADLMPKYEQTYLFGDFNIDILDKNSVLYDPFVEILNMFMLYNVSNKPTRQASGKLLDLFLTSNSSVAGFHQLEVTWSDHDMIFMSVNVKTFQSQPILRKIRNFKKITQSDLLESAVLLDWELIKSVAGVNVKVEILYEYLNKLLNKFAPIKSIKINQTECINSIEHWCNDQVKNAIVIRNKAYRVWHNNINRRKGDRNWIFYILKRKEAKKLIVLNHSKFVNKNLDPNLSSKQLFQNLRKFGIIESKNTAKFIGDANELNNQFIVVPADKNQLDFNVPVLQGVQKFSFQPVDCVDVLNAIKSVKSNAAGFDEIPLSFIKLLIPIILPTLTHIFNYIFTCSTFPDRWKTSIVIPVPKKINPTALTDFRPISLLPTLSKILEVIMADQILKHINENNLLSQFQSGFRRQHSTTTAVLKVTEDIRMNLEGRQVTVVVFLDFSQAFDTVVRALLGKKLSHSFAFAEDANKLLGSYLADRSQFVRTENDDSEVKETLCGVPQGSVLGPLMYVCYSNDVGTVIQFCRFHAYADDLQLYHSAEVSDLHKCYDEINADLRHIAEWARKNGLKLNPKKSQVMLIHRLADNLPQPHLVIDSDTVKVVPKAVNLGFVLNSRLTPVDHYTKVCQKIYWVLRSIRPHASCTPVQVRKKLIQSLILSHINYSNIVFVHTDSTSARKLGVAYNACVRYVNGLGRRESVRELQGCINGLTLEKSATLQLVKFLFKVISTQHPSYIFSLLEFGSSQRTNNLNIPRHRNNAMAHSFSTIATKTWNELPHAIKTRNTLGTFIHAVRTHLSTPI